MIIVDANVLIGFLDSRDAHHVAALRVLDDAVEGGYAASVLTVAEALVHPTLHGSEDRAAAALAEIGLVILPLSAEDALPLARIRAQYQVRMPDAVALHAAMATQARVATFDAALAAAAQEAGVATAGVHSA